MLKILGGDVAKSSLVCWALDTNPTDLKREFRQNKRLKTQDPLTFQLNAESVEQFAHLARSSQGLILEPTGMNYSYLWKAIAFQHGLEVRWVSHPEIRYLRKSERLPDKNDQADALALAAYGFRNWDNPEAFIYFDEGKISRINEIYLDMKSLSRLNASVINRCRSKLSREFPEAAFKHSNPGVDGLSPLFAWIADVERYTDRGNKRYSQLYAESVAPRYGVTISSYTKHLAKQVCDNHLTGFNMQQELNLLVFASSEFESYNQVFDDYGFGLMCRAMLLVRIYPLSRFPKLSAFKRRLGYGCEENSSGGVNSFKKSGSNIARTELHLWCRSTIARGSRLNSEVGRQLEDKFSEISDRIRIPTSRGARYADWANSKLVAVALRWLYRDLRKNCL